MPLAIIPAPHTHQPTHALAPANILFFASKTMDQEPSKPPEALPPANSSASSNQANKAVIDDHLEMLCSERAIAAVAAAEQAERAFGAPSRHGGGGGGGGGGLRTSRAYLPLHNAPESDYEGPFRKVSVCWPRCQWPPRWPSQGLAQGQSNIVLNALGFCLRPHTHPTHATHALAPANILFFAPLDLGPRAFKAPVPATAPAAGV